MLKISLKFARVSVLWPHLEYNIYRWRMLTAHAGGIAGLSMASVMQLSAMMIKIE